MERKKILISAYACHPEMGSEPGMGWNWVSRLARHHDIWLLTEGNRYAPAIQEVIEKDEVLKRHLHVIGIPRHRFGEGIWSHIYYFTYMLWQREAYRKAKDINLQVKFDIVHQLNMIGYREPGYLWKLPVPFIWGPIGGHAQMPWRYLPSLGIRGAWHYGLRNILNWIQMRTSRRVRLAMRNARVLLAATKEDQLAIKLVHGKESQVLSEMGASITNALVEATPKKRKQDEPLRIVWCGLFLERKALPLALHAVKRASANIPIELHIAGSGRCEVAWKRLASKLELDHMIQWHGMIHREHVLDIMRKCHILLFTGLQEATSATVLEAVQTGLPVVCHDICGFGGAIDETCGIKIQALSSKSSIQGFRDALIALGTEKGLLEKLSYGACLRRRDLSWDSKVLEMLKIYDDLDAI